MTDLTFYHNPRCSKSREALELIEARGQQPRIVRYLETPPNATELQELLGKLGISARQLCVAAAVPWSNSSTGPCPIRCTCQRSPPASIN